MKKIFLILCCLCLVLPAIAGQSITYSKYGGCELIVKRHWGWGGDYTHYGLSRNGIEILAPEYEVSYNEELHILTFRREENVISDAYRVVMFCADNGKCLYSSRHYADENDHYKPRVTFEKKGKYTDAVLHYYTGPLRGVVGTRVIGSFFMKDGRLHQVLTKQVAYESSVE